jgi:magnesium transporter
VFGYLPHDRQAELIETAPRGRLARIDTQMEADERADPYNALSEARQQQLLSALVQAEREDLLRLAEEGTAGAIMTSDYATIDAQMSAAEAIAN